MDFFQLVWSTGVCASPLVKRLSSVQKDEKTNVILTDDELRAYKASGSSTPTDVWENVWAVGDNSQMLSTYLPATAQVAAQKAKHLARIMNGEMENEEERRFRHKNMGSMASIGGGKAIVSLSFSRLIPPDYLKSNRALNYQPKGSPVLAVFD